MRSKYYCNRPGYKRNHFYDSEIGIKHQKRLISNLEKESTKLKITKTQHDDIVEDWWNGLPYSKQANNLVEACLSEEVAHIIADIGLSWNALKDVQPTITKKIRNNVNQYL